MEPAKLHGSELTSDASYGQLDKLKLNNGNFIAKSFLGNFKKSGKINLETYKNLEKMRQFQPREIRTSVSSVVKRNLLWI